MKFNLSITMGNDACQTNIDVAKLLKILAKKMLNEYDLPMDYWPIMDENGNKVGEAEIVKD